MKITNLKVNQMKNPLGFSVSSVSLSFEVEESSGTWLKEARIRISDKKDMSHILYDSALDAAGNCETNHMSGDEKAAERSAGVSRLGFCPQYRFQGGIRYYWTVTAMADDGDEGTSETAWFEGGRRKKEWDVGWIASPLGRETHPVMLRSFVLREEKKVSAARLYMVGLGVYELYVNGKKAGDEYLAPFYNDYRHWIQYETYDVEALLRNGKNTVAVMLGNGWYKGRFGYWGEGKDTEIYGDRFLLSAELEITYEDGSRDILCTDESWNCMESPVKSSGIYDGEVYDGRIRLWDEQGALLSSAAASAVPAQTAEPPKGRVEERMSLPLTIHERIGYPRLIRTPKGEQVLDFGQEISGWVEFDCRAEEGVKLFLQYGEILQDGCFYRDNLRSARAEFTYISGGLGHVRPHFTFYGFRYVKVSGVELTEEALEDWHFEACAVYSDLEQLGHITTSNPKLNRLFENTVWGQKGNFVDVPTDCPQRDERLGWTGDAQVFCAAASYHMHTAAFYRKYLKDMLFEQREHGGGVPYTVPDLAAAVREKAGDPEPDWEEGKWGEYGSCAWGDAATVIPWTVYRFYGDKHLLAETYSNMKEWTDFIISVDNRLCGGSRLWKKGFHFADWLALDNPDPESCFGRTDPYYVASVYYMYSASMTARAARILGKKEDAEYYETIAGEVKRAIREEYITKDGSINMDTQTALVLALQFDLVPHELREKTAKELQKKLQERNMHLDTGFVGTAYLCKALTGAGRTEDAYTLLLKEDYPSWLYEVNMGATTVWERWNSVLPNGKISGTGMNSLNHYAYGAVAEWMYETMCGIAPGEDGAGFAKAILAPKPDRRLSHVSGDYHSASGWYRARWEWKEKEVVFEVEVPFDCEAVFEAPEGMEITGVEGSQPQIQEKTRLLLAKGRYVITAAVL